MQCKLAILLCWKDIVFYNRFLMQTILSLLLLTFDIFIKFSPMYINVKLTEQHNWYYLNRYECFVNVSGYTTSEHGCYCQWIYIIRYLNEFKLCFIMITYRIMCSYPWVLRPLISDIYPALALVTDLTCTNISTGGCLILFLLPGHCKEKYINNT